MQAGQIRTIVIALCAGLLGCWNLSGAEPAKTLDALWNGLATREASAAYRSARLMIERKGEATAFLANKIPSEVKLPGILPYTNRRDLQMHRAAYVLEGIGSDAAMRLRARITNLPAAPPTLYQDKRRLDGFGDPLPYGVVLRWGSDRFYLGLPGECAAAISNDGVLLATTVFDRSMRFGPSSFSKVQLWDVATGRMARTVFMEIGLPGGTQLAFTPDGKSLISRINERITVADLATGRIIHDWSTALGPVTTFAIAADGKTIYTGHTDGLFGCFKFPGGREIAHSFIKGADISQIVVTPGKVLVNCKVNDEPEADVWDIKRQAWIVKKPLADGGGPCALAPTGDMIALVTPNGSIELRNVAAKEAVKESEDEYRPGTHRIEFISSDRVLVLDARGGLKVFGIAAGKVKLNCECSIGVNSFVTSPNGRYLAGTREQHPVILDLENGKDIVAGVVGEVGVVDVIISKDRQTALIRSKSQVQQCNQWTLEPLKVLNIAGRPIALGRDGRFCTTTVPSLSGRHRNETYELASEAVLGAPEADPHDDHSSGYGFLKKLLPNTSLAGATVLDAWNARAAHDPFKVLAVDDDGDACASAEDSEKEIGVIRVLESASGKPAFDVKPGGHEARFLPGGRFLVVSQPSGVSSVWDLSAAAAKRNLSETVPEQLSRLWPDLTGDDAPKGYAAAWAFAGAGDAAIAFLRKGALDKLIAGQDDIPRLVRQLDNNSYALRSAAYKRLLALGPAVIPALQKARAASPSMELKMSAQRLIDAFESRDRTFPLLRVAFVLRQIGTLAAAEPLARIKPYAMLADFMPGTK